MHFHFGKDGGAERFFVHLVNGFARAGVEQQVFIRPKRAWRHEIADVAHITESHFRDASLDRLLIPWRVKQRAKKWQPNALFAWMPRACHVMPSKSDCIRIARLGDYPVDLRRFKHIDTLVCNTPGIAEHVKRKGWQRGVECISNFTSTEQVAPLDRRALATPADVPLVVSMGRFVPRKGFDVLLRALARTPDAHMWLLGDGVERQNLEKMAVELGVANRVRFAGWIKDTKPYVAAADVFAMASSHEPLGNVVLEAWAQRVPVVSTRAEGPSWFMTHGRDGLMVDIGDAEGFAVAFQQILADRSLAERLTAGGEQTLLGTFSEQSVVDAYLKLFSAQQDRTTTKAA